MATNEEADLACTLLQGLRRVIDGRCPDADHHDPLALERSKIDLIRGMRPGLRRQAIHKAGNLGRTGALATSGHDQLTRQNTLGRSPRARQREA